MAGPDAKRDVPGAKEKAQAVYRLFAARTKARKERYKAVVRAESEGSKQDLAEYQAVLRSVGIYNASDAKRVGVKWEPNVAVLSSILQAPVFWSFD
jgi:hypothetical protein